MVKVDSLGTSEEGGCEVRQVLPGNSNEFRAISKD